MIAARAAFLCKTPSGFAVMIGDSVTQGALRDPGLCCQTPSAWLFTPFRRDRLQHFGVIVCSISA